MDVIHVNLETLTAGAMSSMCELAADARTQFRLLSHRTFAPTHKSLVFLKGEKKNMRTSFI